MDQDQVPASAYRFNQKGTDLTGSGFNLKGPDLTHHKNNLNEHLKKYEPDQIVCKSKNNLNLNLLRMYLWKIFINIYGKNIYVGANYHFKCRNKIAEHMTDLITTDGLRNFLRYTVNPLHNNMISMTQMYFSLRGLMCMFRCSIKMC
jgi:hypothetical protein